MTTIGTPMRPLALGEDVAQSLRNAVKLGASLMITWAVALVIRIVLPRHLGPANFGAFQFADSFTITVFVLAGLGLETYIRNEVASRPDHATDFFAGTMLVRLGISTVVMAIALWALGAAGKPASVLHLVAIFGLAQVLVNVNNAYGALLHACGSIDGLALLNVGCKLLWGVGVLAVLWFGAGLPAIAWTMLAVEAARSVILASLARRHLGLRSVINMRASGAVLLASMPFYVAALAQTINARVDVSVMAFMTNDREIGWYGAAWNTASISLLMAPLIGWVFLPLSSRAAARSAEEFRLLTQRTMEFVLLGAIPISLMLYLSADGIVRLIFGGAFAPAAHSLRILAPMFVLTYAAMVSGSALIRLGRGWALTWISVGGAIATPLLDVFLIPRFNAAFGLGGAGMAAAAGLITTELATTIVMTALLGGLAFDRRSAIALLKTAAACVVVLAADRVLALLGGWRLLADVLLYFALVISSGALDVRRLARFVRSTLPVRLSPTVRVA